MGRSDGQFPQYVKADIDAERWPAEYWDSSRKCNVCDIAWPNDANFHTSPCCQSNTTLYDGPPDMRWPEAVNKLLQTRFNAWYDEYNEGVSDDILAWEDIKTNGEIDDKKVKQQVNQLIEDVTSAGKPV